MNVSYKESIKKTENAGKAPYAKNTEQKPDTWHKKCDKNPENLTE
jgi:hypothetical protein